MRRRKSFSPSLIQFASYGITYIVEKTKAVMAKVEIKCAENGPEMVTVDGVVFAALCRCGGSKSKPYCDGTHAKIGFKAEAKDIVVTEQ